MGLRHAAVDLKRTYGRLCVLLTPDYSIGRSPKGGHTDVQFEEAGFSGVGVGVNVTSRHMADAGFVKRGRRRPRRTRPLSGPPAGRDHGDRDGSFIHGLTLDGEEDAIVAAIVDLAHALGLFTVAEGVETRRQLDSLRSLGCDRAQGFLFARPGKPVAVDELITEGVGPGG